jgi:hypothetical protein
MSSTSKNGVCKDGITGLFGSECRDVFFLIEQSIVACYMPHDLQELRPSTSLEPIVRSQLAVNERLGREGERERVRVNMYVCVCMCVYVCVCAEQRPR